MSRPPLNGIQTHPLTEHALEILRRVQDSPMPAQEINPGVSNRLLREELIEIVQLPSPYKTHKGKKIAFAQITESGKERLGD
jgi:hypothetical protein